MKQIYLVMCLFTMGCTSATSYGPLGLDGGYSSEQISVNTYQVTFIGNYSTPMKTAVEFALLRSAEVGKRLNQNYLALLNAQAGYDRLTVRNLAHIRTIANQPGSFHTWINFADEHRDIHERPKVVLTIQYSETPFDKENAFPVDAVVDEIKARHKL